MVNVGLVQSFSVTVRVQDVQNILANSSPEVKTMNVRLGASRSVVGKVEMVHEEKKKEERRRRGKRLGMPCFPTENAACTRSIPRSHFL